MNAYDVMKISPIVPVIAVDKLEDALPLALALLEGGINLMEITLRTEAGLEAIEIISKELPQMAVGAGTVINFEGFKKAVEHGAQFVFSPGINTELMDISKTLNIPFIPGVATASDVMIAQNGGFFHCKLFPATAVGGIETLKAFGGPFADMRFCPTGGVNLGNVKEFLAQPNVLCAGGSWIVPKSAIEKKDFASVTRLCKEVLTLINQK